jgi:hypothetical protein
VKEHLKTLNVSISPNISLGMWFSGAGIVLAKLDRSLINYSCISTPSTIYGIVIFSRVHTAAYGSPVPKSIVIWFPPAQTKVMSVAVKIPISENKSIQ